MVRLLERRQPGQDHVGVPCRLVEPKVNGDHRFQHRQDLVELVAAGRGQHRVAGDRDQRLELPVTGCGDLLCHTRHRRLAEDLLGAAHPRTPATEFGDAALQAGQRLRGDRPGRRLREHRAARGVEMACQNVDYVNQPAGQTPKLLIAQPNSAIDHGFLGAGEFAGQCADAVFVDTGDGTHPARRPVRGDPAHRVDTVDVRAGIDQALVEERVRDGQQQRRVGARHDRKPLVGARRGKGAHRVDHDHLAAFANLVDQAHDVGRGQQGTL